MTQEESIQSLPTGATKGRRQDVARDISSAASRYYKDNPEMPDGSPRSRQIQFQIEQEAVRLGLANPNASPEVNLLTAERRVLGNTVVVNGRHVPRGGARDAAMPAVNEFVREGAADLVKAGVISSDTEEGVYAAPVAGAPWRFALLLPSGYPVHNPKTGRAITFDPLEIAAVRHDYDTKRKVAEVRSRHAARQEGRVGPVVVDRSMAPAQRAEALAKAAPVMPVGDDGEPFPSFLDFLQEHRVKRQASAQGQ
jgi:hypothetical protein